MRYLLLFLVFNCSSLLPAQAWRINAEAGLAGFPQSKQDPGLQIGLYLERSLPITPKVSLDVFGGIRQLRYTNTEQYVGAEPLGEIPDFCDCIFPNNRFLFDRTEANAGAGLTYKTGRFSISPRLSLAYDLYSEVTQQFYDRINEPGALLVTNRQRLWKEYSRPFETNRSQSRELSRRIHTYAGLTLGYQLSHKFQLRLLWQQSLGQMKLTWTEYRERSAYPNNIIYTRGPVDIVDAGVRSLLFGVSYRL